MAITVKAQKGKNRGKSSRYRSKLKKKEKGRRARWYK